MTRLRLSSINKKQVVAVTGLFLILFVVVHLSGNLLIYFGPKVFNGYANKIASLRPEIYPFEFFFFIVFLIHLDFTARVIWENFRARPVRYQCARNISTASPASRWMFLSGMIIAAFIVWHLKDLTFTDHAGPRSILPNGQEYGLFGVVYNSLGDPIHCVLYIIAMVAVGVHLSHSIQGVFQTFGLVHDRRMSMVRWISNGLGVIVGLAYSSIPVYVQFSYGVFR